MPLKDSDLKSLMLWPSLRGVIYQAKTLSAQLERINKEEFPPEACLVKDVFQCLAAYILDELVAIQNPSDPFEMDIDTATRIRSMAGYLRTIHSYIRYLTASSPRQSPPAVQNEIVRQTKRHFPKEYGNPICIVRPQWTYNLKCVPISEELKKLSKSALDPANKLSLKPGETVLSALWDKYLKKLRAEGKEVPRESPNQIGVLSFPSIDTPDTLLLPLLGHELGHFIAFAPPTPYHEDTDLLDSAKISEDRVYEIIEQVTGKPAITSEATRYYSILKLQVSICLRELLADRLAARMLGLSFFLAQAKFIKTTTHWNHPLISEIGYPNIRLRLSAIFNEITAQEYPGNPLLFLKENSLHHPDITKPLLNYLAVWQQHFADAPVIKHQKSAVIGEELLVEPFYELVENALNETTFEILDRIAKQVIPDSKCARLSSRFFERIVRLSKDLPPSLPGEDIDSFAEILSAGWAYQVVIGESREMSVPDNPSTIDEHTKTCNLILKAIELILVQETKTNTQSVSVDSRFTSSRRSGKLSRVLKGFPVIKRLLPAIEVSTQFEDRKGVLSFDEIKYRTKLPLDNTSRIDISPLHEESINAASLDVRLGNWFAYARRTKLSGIRIGDKEDEALLRTTGQGEAFVPHDKTFLLHPGDLALGVTQEFISLPNDVMAFVEGRSSLGRLGLFVATATQVAPGFHGVVVLELANAGTVPLELKPGIEIAQLVFQVMTHPVPSNKLYRGKYYCQIKPLV